MGEFRYAVIFSSHCLDDWRVPAVVTRGEGQKRFQLFFRRVNAFLVSLIDDEDVANLHDSGLDRLNIVTHARHQHHHGNIGCFDYFDLVLTDADCFDDDLRVTGGIENRDCIDRRSRQSAEIAACRHGANENTFVQAERLHPYPVTQDRSARKWTRRVDCDNANTLTALAIEHRELINKGRLTGARRTSDSDHECAT